MCLSCIKRGVGSTGLLNYITKIAIIFLYIIWLFLVHLKGPSAVLATEFYGKNSNDIFYTSYGFTMHL